MASQVTIPVAFLDLYSMGGCYALALALAKVHGLRVGMVRGWSPGLSGSEDWSQDIHAYATDGRLVVDVFGAVSVDAFQSRWEGAAEHHDVERITFDEGADAAEACAMLVDASELAEAEAFVREYGGLLLGLEGL